MWQIKNNDTREKGRIRYVDKKNTESICYYANPAYWFQLSVQNWTFFQDPLYS